MRVSKNYPNKQDPVFFEAWQCFSGCFALYGWVDLGYDWVPEGFETQVFCDAFESFLLFTLVKQLTDTLEIQSVQLKNQAKSDFTPKLCAISKIWHDSKPMRTACKTLLWRQKKPRLTNRVLLNVAFWVDLDITWLHKVRTSLAVFFWWCFHESQTRWVS